MLYGQASPAAGWMQNSAVPVPGRSGTSTPNASSMSLLASDSPLLRCAASSAGVGCVKIDAIGTRRPSRSPSAGSSRVASSEVPPRSKKSSSTPTRSRPRCSANRSVTSVSRSVLGAR
ncbi:hypothetical protein NJ76_31525 [Rhodococcus sp. IITR03]|nr:hypothetical protein NJ76_31525 [Rhodococcus sp. IITR03]